MVICLEQGADLHTAQLMPLPLTVSCFSKIPIGFTFLVPAHPGSPRQRAVKRVCVHYVLKDLFIKEKWFLSSALRCMRFFLRECAVARSTGGSSETARRVITSASTGCATPSLASPSSPTRRDRPCTAPDVESRAAGTRSYAAWRTQRASRDRRRRSRRS